MHWVGNWESDPVAAAIAAIDPDDLDAVGFPIQPAEYALANMPVLVMEGSD